MEISFLGLGSILSSLFKKKKKVCVACVYVCARGKFSRNFCCGAGEMKPQRMNACCLWARWLWRRFGVCAWHRAKFRALSASWGRGQPLSCPLLLMVLSVSCLWTCLGYRKAWREKCGYSRTCISPPGKDLRYLLSWGGGESPASCPICAWPFH